MQYQAINPNLPGALHLNANAPHLATTGNPLKQGHAQKEATLYDLFYNNEPPAFFDAFAGRVLPEPRLQHIPLPAQYTDNFNVNDFMETLQYFDAQGMSAMHNNDNVNNNVISQAHDPNVPMGVIAALSDGRNVDGLSSSAIDSQSKLKARAHPPSELNKAKRPRHDSVSFVPGMDQPIPSTSSAEGANEVSCINGLSYISPVVATGAVRNDEIKLEVARPTKAKNVTSSSNTNASSQQPAIKKRKRNRMAQKRYRDRKKCEANELLNHLNEARKHMQELETDRVHIIEEHTRNAVLLHKEKLKNAELARLREELAQLRASPVDMPLRSMSHDMALSSETMFCPLNPLDASNSESNNMVKEIVDRKFLEDAYEHIADEFRLGCKADRAQVMRLPLLLSYVREQILA